MIERLNFYDVYGYLLPGLALLGVLAFPVWIVTGWTPPAALASALAALILGYLLGHVLARPAQLAFPSGRLEQGPGGLPVWRRPSDYLVDTLGEPTRSGVVAAIRQRFGLEIGRPGAALNAGEEEALRGLRNTAFLFCRRALLQKDVGSYAEQFEGLYALMRGMTAVAALACAYHLGWLGMLLATRGGPWTLQPALELSWILLGGAVPVLLGTTAWDYVRDWRARREEGRPPDRDRSQLAAVSAVLVPLGALAAAGWASARPVDDRALGVLFGALFLWIWLGFRFASAHHAFAAQFVHTVYRDFYVLERYPAPPAAAPGG